MESVVMLPARGLDAAEQIINLAERQGIRLRLLGGLAFKKLCPSASAARYNRENKDIDLMGKRENHKEVVKIMETLGYRPREMFNKLAMGKRLIYYDLGNRRRVDIFFDEFEMCHRFNFRDSLEPGTFTLPITELVMTKLQVMEKTEKEYRDLLAAFSDYEVTAGVGGIDGGKIASICAADWGVYTTFTKSLAALKQMAGQLAGDDRALIVARVDALQTMLDAKPKTLAWRMRSRIGEKARWYETPESDGDAMLN
jgi:hypothetical protein